MKVHWIEFIERVWFLRFNVGSSFKRRAIWTPADHFIRVCWFRQINTGEIYLSSVSGGIAYFTASIPSFKLGCERHKTESRDQGRFHHNEMFSFKHQIIMFVVIEDFQLEFLRIDFRNRVEVTKPEFAYEYFH